MSTTRINRSAWVALSASLFGTTGYCLAIDRSPPATDGQHAGQTDPYRWQPLSLAQLTDTTQAQADTRSEDQVVARSDASPERYGYREVSDFFNIREANPQVDHGEWEFEIEGGWFTRSDGTDDDFGLAQTLKYGITDAMFVELEVLEPTLGDGADQGNGDLAVVLFNRFVGETETLPAIAGFVELRIPTGDGSSGVDASFNGIITKTIVDKLRAHFEGFVETANGASGARDEDRRHFQWGLGPGLDYQIDDKTLALVNYLHRSSEDYGRHNQNILEFGVIRELFKQGDVHQHLKAAVDVGLDGQDETPNFGVKFQWSIDWK